MGFPERDGERGRGRERERVRESEGERGRERGRGGERERERKKGGREGGRERGSNISISFTWYIYILRCTYYNPRTLEGNPQSMVIPGTRPCMCLLFEVYFEDTLYKFICQQCDTKLR